MSPEESDPGPEQGAAATHLNFIGTTVLYMRHRKALRKDIKETQDNTKRRIETGTGNQCWH